ncbi:hypothetical protein, partial [Pedobacter sp. ASV12]|uniref:hypothetical protein n=1 Tax=Pedobacter sp. ASV12 TaxID=2795120 RepID=UPI0018EABC52
PPPPPPPFSLPPPPPTHTHVVVRRQRQMCIRDRLEPASYLGRKLLTFFAQQRYIQTKVFGNLSDFLIRIVVFGFHSIATYGAYAVLL